MSRDNAVGKLIPSESEVIRGRPEYHTIYAAIWEASIKHGKLNRGAKAATTHSCPLCANHIPRYEDCGFSSVTCLVRQLALNSERRPELIIECVVPGSVCHVCGKGVQCVRRQARECNASGARRTCSAHMLEGMCSGV